VNLPIDRFADKEFWLDLNPGLSITDIPNRGLTPPAPLEPIPAQALSESLDTRGFFTARSAFDPSVCTPLAVAVQRLVAAGIPTPFLFVYDEVWQLLSRAGAVLGALVAPEFLVGGDLWVWHVAPDAAAAGWSVHRDDNRGDGTLPDGRAAMVTTWVPLTEATPANGCMYLLPTDRDPNVPEHLDSREIGQSELSSIRAVPASPGDVLGWNTRLLHWGSRSSDQAVVPRISVSIYCQRRDVEPHSDDFVPLDGAIPLHHRLGIVSRALLTYESSGLTGTSLPDGVREFAKIQRGRLAKWLAMTADLRAPHS
jgi:phytanoyl-CoA dioxygenase PhyH